MRYKIKDLQLNISCKMKKSNDRKITAVIGKQVVYLYEMEGFFWVGVLVEIPNEWIGLRET
jgi:hypothetical protein